jgi:cation diffusion facilitator family transporter
MKAAIMSLPARAREALRNPFFVMGVVILMYVIKATLKITVGTRINSPMIAGDGWHNLADIFEALAVIAVIFVARMPSSAEYPFGRKNIEFFTKLLIGAGLGFMAVRFAVSSVVGLLALWPEADEAVRSLLPLPAHEPLIMNHATFPWVVGITAGSVLLSVLVSRYQIFVGKHTGHASLVADGEETASDGRIEAVVLLGVLGEYVFQAAWIEYPLGLVVAFLIGRTGAELFLDGWRVLLQHSIGTEHEAAIRSLCARTPGVIDIARLKTFRVGPTAVCMLTVVTRHNNGACAHIKYGIEHAVREYILEQDFQCCEIDIEFRQPDPQRHRVAYGVVKSDLGAVIAPTLGSATHLAICDVEHGKVVRATLEPQPADPVQMLVTKRVVRLYLLDQAEHELPALVSRGIDIVAAPSYLPSVMGLGALTL